jgi:hypothetical protein
MTGEMFAAFCVSLGGDHAARLRDVPHELAGKRTDLEPA